MKSSGVQLKKIRYFLLGLIFTAVCFPVVVQARVTPEDIVNAKRDKYQEKVNTYTSDNKAKLSQLSQSIVDLNQLLCTKLTESMSMQAAILDEYERRVGEKQSEEIKDARYWITYAHEAVAYQAAKNYVPDLSTQSNIKNDQLSMINLFQNEMMATRKKVLFSQTTLAKVIK